MIEGSNFPEVCNLNKKPGFSMLDSHRLLPAEIRFLSYSSLLK